MEYKGQVSVLLRFAVRAFSSVIAATDVNNDDDYDYDDDDDDDYETLQRVEPVINLITQMKDR